MLYQVNWSWKADTEKLVSDWVVGFSLNVCCGKSLVGDVRVDLDRSLRPDVIASVYNLPFHDNSFSTVICDPPFDLMRDHVVWIPELFRVGRRKVIISHSPRNFFVPVFWDKTLFATQEEGYEFMRLFSIFVRPIWWWYGGVIGG